MAGLDTRGLASGFQAGFGMMDQYYAREDQGRRQEEQLNMQREQFDMQKGEATRSRDMEQIQLAIGKVANGMDVSEEEIQTLQKYPQYWSALDPGTDSALEQAERVVNPDDPADINDPESIDALNTVFGPEVGKGDGGKKRIRAAVPSPDGEGLIFELDVEREDGSHYNAPITERRSADDDDPVRSIPIDDVVKRVSGMRALRKAMQSPEAQAKASQLHEILTGKGDEGTWEQVEGPGGSILQRNTKTGETKRVIGRAPSSSGYQDRPTSTMKDAQWMVENGIAADLSEAYEKIANSRGGVDPYERASDEIDYLGKQIEDINSTKSDPVAWRSLGEGERNELNSRLEQLRERRDRAAEELYPQREGTGLNTSGQPEPEPEPEPRAERIRPEPQQPERETRGTIPGSQGTRRTEPSSPSKQADELLKSILG